MPSQSTPLSPASISDYKRFGHTIAKSGGGPNGRRLLWGAVCNLPGRGGPTGGIPNPKSRFTKAAKTHHGCTMSLGQELRLASDRNTLTFHFLPELRSLRQKSVSGVVGGRLLEIQANLTGSAGKQAGLSLFGGLVTLTHDPTTHELAFSGNATLADDGNRVAVPLTLTPGENLSLHVYVDGSIVEAIANDRAPVSAVVTPAAGDAFESVAVLGGSADSLSEPALQLKIWDLTPTVEFEDPGRSLTVKTDDHQQVSLPQVEKMPNVPRNYLYTDYADIATKLDAWLFNDAPAELGLWCAGSAENRSASYSGPAWGIPSCKYTID